MDPHQQPRLGFWAATTIGLAAGSAALGAGHLVAGLVGPNASPYLAVGGAFVDRTPSWLKDFAVRTFGTHDKLVLLLGLALTVLALVAAAGALSRHRPAPGLALLTALGLVGTLAILDRPDVGQLGPLAGVAALATAVLSFGWLHAQALTASTEPTERAGRPTSATGMPDTLDPDGGHAGSGGGRRRLLVAAAATVAGAGAAGLAGQLLGGRVDVQASRRAVGEIRPTRPQPPIPVGADFAGDGTPAFITPNRDFYRIDTALVVPRLRAEQWSLRVHGLVARELRLDYENLRRRELVEHTVTLTCVSNEVGGPYVSTATFVGVLLRDVLREAGVRSGADQLASRSSDGWTCGTPTAAVLDDSRAAMLAIAMNGEPLPAEHGFPVRLVIPGLYGYVSATKWLVDLELTTFGAFDAYWTRRGWAEQAPVKTMSRIDRPTGFQQVAAGRVVVAGVAWAQTRGVEVVQVQVDDGPWTEATLASEVNLDSWRMWHAELDLAPGGHTVRCRATDRSGHTQTQERADPVPDGATGWHSVFFTVV